MNDLIKMIDDLVEKKTFSFEAVQAVNRLRSEAVALQEQVNNQRETIKFQKEGIDNQTAEISRLQGRQNAMLMREADVVVRERTASDLEKKTAVAEAVAASTKEIVTLIFRNVEVRQRMQSINKDVSTKTE